MTTSEHIVDDIADDGEHGERQAIELADRIRMVAAEDPELAQELVDQLIAALDEATNGTFREHLGGPDLLVAERVGGGTGAQAASGVVSPRNG